MVVLRPLVRGLLHVVEAVVHPAHVPLVVKAEAAVVDGLRDTGVLGGIFGREDGGRVQLLEAAVHVADEVDGILVGAPVLVALPVDEVRQGVDAKAVEVELLQPVVRVGLEETLDLALAVVEVVAPPLAVTHVGVRVLVERRAVILLEGVVVHREVDGHEVEDDADLVLVAVLDELLQLVHGAVAGGRGVEARVLVPPGVVRGVLRQRQELDVVVAVFLDIGDQ